MSKVSLCTASSTPQAFHFYIARAYPIINLQALYHLLTHGSPVREHDAGDTCRLLLKQAGGFAKVFRESQCLDSRNVIDERVQG